MSRTLLLAALLTLLPGLISSGQAQHPQQTTSSPATKAGESLRPLTNLAMPPLCLIEVLQPASDLKTDFSTPSRFILHTEEAEDLESFLTPCHFAAPPQTRTNSLVLTVDYGSCQEDPPLARHRAPSFIIDYDAPEFKKILEEVENLYGASPSLTELAQYTNRYIDNKQSASYLSFASTVARQRSGDCKEHALFAAALGRGFGYPSRVMLGIVLNKAANGSWIGFGHAWPEAYDTKNRNWIGFDGTMIRSTVDNGYIPLRELTDEGVTYMMQIIQVAQHGIRQLEILGTATLEKKSESN